MQRTAASLFIVLISSGCAHSLSPRDIRPLYNDSSVTEVEGLRASLDSSPDAPVRVLVLHGMGMQKAGYSEDLQKNIKKQLNPGLVPGNVTQGSIQRGYKITIFDGRQPSSSKTEIPLSLLTRTTWNDPNHHPRLVFYEVLWAVPRDVVKNRFIACFESRVQADECQPSGPILPNEDSQGLINRFGKNRLMVGGFSDASIILSPVGDVLRDDLHLALCTIAADVAGHDVLAAQPPERCDLTKIISRNDRDAMHEKFRATKFSAITHSLGSFLLFDGQLRFARMPAKSSDEVARDQAAFYLLDNKTVFMRANQVALLNLARLRAVCEPLPCPNRLLRIDDEVSNDPDAHRHKTTYVAFNDHNDLLGFELPPYLAERDAVGTLVNVSVRNARWWIPGILKDPVGAHQGSDHNPAVIQAIVEGFRLPPRAQPR